MEQVVTFNRPVTMPPARDLRLPGRGVTCVRHLRRPGRRPTVVLLHGLAATADLNWGTAYAALGRRFDVVSFDHRGHGRGLRGAERFTLEGCADDVAAIVGELGVGPAIVVGYSMGGPIAQLVWRRHPDAVAGVVLCATSDVFCASPRDRGMFAAATGAAALARSRPSRFAVHLVGKTLARREPSPGSLGCVLSHDWAQVLAAAQALGRFDSRGWLPSIDVPVATVTTLHDEVVPTRRQRAMAATLPLVGEALVGGGHRACLHPDSGFAEAVVDMCDEIAAAGDAGELRRAG